MAQNETARATVYLDGKQAEAALSALAQKAKDLRKDLTDALQAGDNVKYDKLKRELSGIEAAQRSLKKETFDVERVLQNINKVSWRDLQKAQSTITNQLKGMTRGTEEYLKKSEELKKVKTALADINNETRAANKSWSLSGMADGFNKYLGLITAFIASLTGLAMGFKQVVQSFNDFQERVANLSSLTGLKGEALDWMSNKAKELSTSVLEGGIRITKGAQDIVDGFTKMGSARPELLKDKEALVQVTENALILAEASKIEMVPAIDAVAASMNQFNLDASQTGRIINTIAAGSLEGSAEVADLTESMKNVGTVAADSNMSLEQTVAALEVLAEKQLKGVEGGTKLRGALLKMKEAGVGYASGQFILRDALVEANAKIAQQSGELEKDALKQKMFGIENITAGNILLQNVDKYDKLTAAVTGTNVALVQAATNTDTNNAKLAQAKNRINIVSIELGEKLSPAMAMATGWFGKMLSGTLILVNFLTKYGTTIVAVTATIAAYVTVVKIAAYWDNIHYGYLAAKTAITKAYHYTVDVLTGKITLATVAQNAWNLAQKLNPIGLIVGLLVAAGAALYLYTRKLSDAEIAQKALNDINQKAKQSINSEKVEMEQLLRVAQNEALSKAARQEAIEKLNKISPEYLGGLTLETINTKAATIATDQYVAALEKKARTEAALENIKNATSEIERLKAGEGGDPGFFKQVWNYAKNPLTGAISNAISKAENANERIKELTIQLKIYQDTLDKEVKTPSPGSPNDSSGGGSSGETPAEKKAREKAEKAALKEAKKAEKAASDALELAHKQRVLILTEQYAGEEQRQKEFHARMLAEEEAYILAQIGLEKDPLKKVDLETQLINKHQQYLVALKDVTGGMMKNSSERKNIITTMNDEAAVTARAARSMKKLSDESEKLSEKQANQAKIMQETIGLVSDGIFEMMSGTEGAFQDFAKNILIFALEQLKAQAELAIAGVTIAGLASLNPVKMVVAGAKILAIEAAFAAVEGIVSSTFSSKKSKGKQSGGYADSDVNDSTPVGVYHANEFIASAPAVRNPTVKPILDIIDIAQRTGTIRSLNLPAAVGQSGRKSGGYATPVTGQAGNLPNDRLDGNTELLFAIKELNNQLKQGIKANAYINKFGTNGLSDALNDIANFNSKIGKKS